MPLLMGNCLLATYETGTLTFSLPINRPANLVESKTWRFWPKKFFRPPSSGAWGMLHQKMLKISVLRLAENAFPTFETHQFVVKVLRSSGNTLEIGYLNLQL